LLARTSNSRNIYWLREKGGLRIADIINLNPVLELKQDGGRGVCK
jgi:hypothetical protein